jgi:hypothetical protein
MKDVFVTGHYLNIVLELADGGGLFLHVNNCLRDNEGVMKEDDARWGHPQRVSHYSTAQYQ